jgi:hypothetical protein
VPANAGDFDRVCVIGKKVLSVYKDKNGNEVTKHRMNCDFVWVIPEISDGENIEKKSSKRNGNYSKRIENDDRDYDDDDPPF